MDKLIIRGLDESLISRLRVRAALHDRSPEEEARHILNTVLSENPVSVLDLVQRIRQRFIALGDVQLAVVEREPMR